jgi:tetratricopeptide (TPR) repeat protein
MASGIELFEQCRYEEARPCLKGEAEAEHPSGLATLYLAAIEAQETCDRAIIERTGEKVRGVVDDDLIEQVVGAFLFRLGHQREGLARMQEAVRVGRQRANNHLVLAACLYKAGRFEEAESYYSSALAQNDECWTAYWGLASLHRKREDVQGATRLLTKACQINGYDAELRYELAGALWASERWDDAIGQFQAALDLGYGEVEDAMAGIAECHYRAGRHTKALEYLEAATKANPESEMVQRVRGLLDGQS